MSFDHYTTDPHITTVHWDGPISTTPQLAHNLVTALGTACQNISFAESLTAGMACSQIADIPGASSVLAGGVTTYTAEAKHILAGVNRHTMDRDGTVAASTASEMATGIAQRLHTDWAVSFTGVAGPGPWEDKPAGTIYLAIARPHPVHRIRCYRLNLGTDRATNRIDSVHIAYELVLHTMATPDHPYTLHLPLNRG